MCFAEWPDGWRGAGVGGGLLLETRFVRAAVGAAADTAYRRGAFMSAELQCWVVTFCVGDNGGFDGGFPTAAGP